MLFPCPAKVARDAGPSGGGGSRKSVGAAGPMPRARYGAESAGSRRAKGRMIFPCPAKVARDAGPSGGGGSRKSVGAAGPMPRGRYGAESAENGRGGERRAIPVAHEDCAGRRAEQRGREPKRRGGRRGRCRAPDQLQTPTKRKRPAGERSCVIRKKWAARTSGGGFIGNRAQRRGGIKGRTPLL
jgi:hypothetical protein